MKAFQLKIMIKNSKPPIWRRVVVPAGITFSQLSVILNEVMGWRGYHLFQFEFYHQGLCVMENAEEFDDFGQYDYIEASTTCIDEVLKRIDWFTYVYDLGDDWQHRVTVEKILDDWELNYPQVLKYKGDCPIEDCGGIWGYYECLHIINDLENPEREERLKWLNGQGYPQVYDMETVNETLQQQFYYNFGKGENRPQNEIYEDQFHGKYGLNAAKFGMTLKEIFGDYNKTDLIEIAKEKGIKGLSGKNKDQLIEKLYDFMMQDTEIRRYFYCMTAEDRREFEQVLNPSDLYEPEYAGCFCALYKAAYIGMQTNGCITVTDDVKEAYQRMRSDAFERESDKRSFVLACLATAKWLYGIVPFAVFEKLVNTGQEEALSEAEILQILKEIPTEYMEFVIKSTKLYHTDLYPDDRELSEVQGDREYYIPTKEEIADIGKNGYLSQDKYIQRFQRYLKNILGAAEEEADYIAATVWHLINDDREIEEIMELLDNMELLPESEKEIYMLFKKLQELWNHTRKITYRGFTPSEIEQQEKELHRTIPIAKKVVNFDEARKNKIYPNDPCPCGSGKKYKNCCRNKK